MQFKIIFIFLFISTNLCAHKDKVIAKNYGNIKIYMKTGFNYSEIDKIQIIGQLSEKLASRLQYQDTLLIEYIHDYTDNFKDNLYLLEPNNSNYKLAYGLNFEDPIPSNHQGLSVRIYADSVDIVKILHLVEYSILNHQNLSKQIIKTTMGYNVYEDEVLLEPLVVIATNEKLIEEIFNAESSKSIKDIISERIPIILRKHYGMEIYWSNNTFFFEYKNYEKRTPVYEIKDYYYHLFPNQNFALLFIDEQSFYYLDDSNNSPKKLMTCTVGSNAPIRTMNFGDKVLLQHWRDLSRINMLLTKKNKVITKFE